MCFVFRLLLWLSITVLSFQGSAVMALGQAEEPVHEMVVATGQQHYQAASQSGGEHCSEHDSKAAASPHIKCAACANCCVASAAPPALTPTFHAPPLPSSLHANPEAAMTSFIPSALERPPRAFFV
jgi:hypothetical protein